MRKLPSPYTKYDIRYTSAFTLIELLVVISIIGILAALVTVSFTSSQRQARDAARKSDLRQYQTSLESYANKNGGLYVSRAGAGSGVVLSTTICTDLGLTTCPEDPKNATDNTYTYKYKSNGTGGGTVDATVYVLWGKLENSSNYWVVCSIGKNGTMPQTWNADPPLAACPL